MSNETMRWLNENTLIGFTDKRGTAWHRRADLQGEEPNHFAGPVPVEAVKRRLFGWDAVASPVYVENPATGGLTQAPDRQALIRSDNGHVMGIFSEGYEPHPYREWLVDTVGLLLDDDLSIGSAGLLRQGAVAWVSVEVPDNITTPEGVEFRPHLLACTSFDGSLATTFKRSITNVVCDNTMALALKRAGEQVKIKHSRHSKLRLGQAREALNIIWQAAEEYSTQVAELCRIDVTDRDWNAFLDAHVPLPEAPGRSRTRAGNRRDTLTRLWRWDNRVAPWHGTAYGVVQAVNTHAHHEQTVRGAERPERNMLRAVTGEFDELDRSTLHTLLKAIDAGAAAYAA